MKENTSTKRRKRERKGSAAAPTTRLTMGIDVGDRRSRYATVNRAGKLIEEGEATNATLGPVFLLFGRRRDRK